ncbi:sigma-54 dependent transcriptional regulator [Fulvivirga maritima]|uniref:sigma-54-dependent transcriptional regulator n=1 Tax=Fulvivirga maritima TaxID=2904247 RepID=UPI001F362EED|nr:sigma-54 dependent transcriptional regulator [Fulvivirga maritima]UII28903.1 sigma-54 dependent transcriptional regulator [Fulvivirga maritima]
MPQTYRIFIVEDDPWFGEMLKYHLSQNPDHEVELFKTAKEVLASLSKNPDLITLDYSLPDIDGDELFSKIKSKLPNTPVIVVSGQEQVGIALKLLKMGVSDYFIKNDDTKELVWNAVGKIKETQDLREEVKSLKQQLDEKYDFDKLIKGNSPQVTKLFEVMNKAAKTNINVSITGETGTGKELVAQAIHYNSPRKNKAFVPVNMAAIPANLLESELFGYEKGAFTGAVGSKPGKFEEANKGTIFLDEIGEMPLELQSKLLRVLQEREITRLGSNKSIQLDIRVIIATHKNLAAEVNEGNFREDLYYRIVGLPITSPPLRERGNDIFVLAEYFLKQFSKENKLDTITIDKHAKKKLMGYGFPGNIRELKSIIELAAVMCDDNTITEKDISFIPTDKKDSFVTEEKTMKEYNKDIIRHFLEKYDNNVLKVAKKLDIGKSTIYKMIKEGEL